MNKGVTIIALAAMLAGCMSLPGSDTPPPRRYMLQGEGGSCSEGGEILSLSVVRVGAGLNSDRIARKDATTGAFSVLKDVRWVDRTGAMLEQRLAEDLECRGYTVLTSHHSRLDHAQLVCEARSLNLVAQSGSDRAEVSLSCLFFQGPNQETAIQAEASSPLRSWNADSAARATSLAYQEAFRSLADQLP